MDAHRPDELTPQRHRPSHRTGQPPAQLHQRSETISHDQLARQIDELEQNLRREDPALAEQFNKLRRAHTRNDVTVFSLLAASAMLLAIALATTSRVAGLGGVAAYLAAFLVDHRHQRKLRQASTVQRTQATWR